MASDRASPATRCSLEAITAAGDFRLLDLRDVRNCQEALSFPGGPPEEVYQLAADGVRRYLWSSSVCVCRDMESSEPELREEQATLPANSCGGGARRVTSSAIGSSLLASLKSGASYNSERTLWTTLLG